VRLLNDASAERSRTLNELRQRLTVAVLAAFVVVVLGFVFASAFGARRLEPAPCGRPVQFRDGSVVVFTCEEDDAPRGSEG
jgi:succinate dehydrogenase hydrophobic anchor subunit